MRRTTEPIAHDGQATDDSQPRPAADIASRRSMPIPPQISSKVIAPIAQRQNTTSANGWPELSTNQPMVPETSMAAVISNEPRRMDASMMIYSRVFTRGNRKVDLRAWPLCIGCRFECLPSNHWPALLVR